MATDWYYALENRRMGPVAEEELDSLAASGAIAPQTLVWRAGMEGWRPYSSAMASCSQCRGPELPSEMVQFGTVFVCANCKDLYTQKLREGTLKSHAAYAGFMRRGVAYMIDSVILLIMQFVVQFAHTAWIVGGDRKDVLAFTPHFILLQVLFTLMNATYYTLSVFLYGATPGKALCGCRVVSVDGVKLTLGRSIARYLASVLSFFIAGIGFLMAAFDDEKRTLHDRLCDTRVIR